MLGGKHIARIAFTLSLLAAAALSSTITSASYSQSTDKMVASISATIPLNFSAPHPMYPSPAWVLSTTINANNTQNKMAILSQFDPLWQEKLVSGKFEEVQSIIIPGGIIDVANNVIYMENGTNDVVALDIKSGKIIRHLNNICCPIAVVDNSLLALSKTKDDNKLSYDLKMLDGKTLSNKWGALSLPDWLELPTDGERQKFIFNAHCYNHVLSVAWQASRRQMFPNPLFLIIPSMAQPTAMQGTFTCALKDQTIISQTIQDSDADFLGYLTANENLPAQIVLDSDTIAIRKYNYYLFLLVRSYPPENNIAGAGILAKRELRVKDMRTGKILWSHILPASFMPLAF